MLGAKRREKGSDEHAFLTSSELTKVGRPIGAPEIQRRQLENALRFAVLKL